MFNNINRHRFGLIKKSISLKQYQHINKSEDEEIIQEDNSVVEPDKEIWEVFEKQEDDETFDNFNPVKRNYDTNTINVDEEIKKINVAHEFLKNISIKKLKDVNKYKRNI